MCRSSIQLLSKKPLWLEKGKRRRLYNKLKLNEIAYSVACFLIHKFKFFFIFSRMAIRAKLQQNTCLPVPVYRLCVTANVLIAGYNV
jgi:hypothetical protein